MRLIIWMLRLYPLAWRERYEEEMVALLEQHKVTLWTVVDLLVGVIDARLDPHYRRARQILPAQRLYASRRLLISAGVAFWLAFLFPIDIEPGPNAPPLPSTPWIIPPIYMLSIMAIPFIFTAFVGGIGWLASRNRWHLLRLLPIPVCMLILIPLSQLNTLIPQEIVLAITIILTAESAGVALAGRKGHPASRQGDKRPDLLQALSVRFLALCGIAGMMLFCMFDGTSLVALWKLDPWAMAHQWGLIEISIGFLMIMVVATILALFAFVRSLLALKDIYATKPKQEPLSADAAHPSHADQQEFSQETLTHTTKQNGRSLPISKNIGNKLFWPIVVLLFFISVGASALPNDRPANYQESLMTFTSFFLLSCMLIGLVIKKSVSSPMPGERVSPKVWAIVLPTLVFVFCIPIFAFFALPSITAGTTSLYPFLFVIFIASLLFIFASMIIASAVKESREKMAVLTEVEPI